MMLNFSSWRRDRVSAAELYRTSFSRMGFLGSFLFCGLSWFSPVQAQITGDGTLNMPTTVNTFTTTPCLGNCTIADGTPKGNNLFHSFSEFSLPNASYSATFTNSGLQNLFIRVTGGSASYINGTINFTNFENVFFLNPNGITFGSSAFLNLQGSFTASTGTGVNFADGTTFLTTETMPQLTMSVPVGLQVGANAAPIHVQNSALFLPSGNSLSLVGGDISITQSSTLFIPDNGEIHIKGNNISLSNFSQIFSLAGNVTIMGNNLTLSDNSIVSVNSSANQSGGILKIDIAESVSIIGSTTGLYARNLGGNGNAGNIQISTQNLRLQDGGTISNSTLDSGNAGKITIEATNINLMGFGNVPSGIYSESLQTATGNGGRIKINTENLILQYGARISTSTSEISSGLGGNLDINATNIKIMSSGNGQPSLLTTETFGSANAGNLNVSTDRLSVSNGAQILVKSGGLGIAGSLNITANTVELNDRGLLSAETLTSGGEITLQNLQSLSLTNNSKISASTVDGQGGNIFGFASDRILVDSNSSIISQATGNGSAGNIGLDTRDLTVQNNSEVSASTVNGQGGNIFGFASDRILVDSNSSIISQATGNGSAGNVQLDTRDLTVQNNSQVSVRSEGTGNAGTLTVNAEDILLSDRGKLTASTAAGNGGNIELTVAGSIFLRFNSEISAEAGGMGNGGNITMDVGDFIIAFLPENSDIVASAFQGRGGTIYAKAQGIFGFRQFRGVRTPESDFTATSVLGIDGTVTINGVDNFSLDGIPESFIDTTVARGCNVGENPVAFYNVGRGGLRDNYSTPLSSSEVWEDVTLPQYQGDRTSNRIVEAQEWGVNEKGEVVLFARDTGDRILLPCS